MKVKKQLPEQFKMQIDNLIKDLNPRAVIKQCIVKVNSSILEDLNINWAQTYFGGNNITKDNIYTSGKMYEKFSKCFNTIYENSKDIRGVQFKLVKTYKSWVDQYVVKNYINSENEYRYYNYSVVAIFEGETEKYRKAQEEYKKKKEEEEKAARERRQRCIEHIAYYKELNKNKEYVDLGCANGWGETPEIVKIADKDDDCFYESENLGRCYNKYICHKYKFYYTVDSSD
jgi:hypothetical protein